MLPLTRHQPKTLAQAAEILVESLTQLEREELRAIADEDLVVRTHFGLGAMVREAWLYGPARPALWADAHPYPDDDGLAPPHDDEISAAIIYRAWRILREQS